MQKSPDAFRTISEVAEWLDVPTHVLRFWESRFSQIKPVKRAGGRRYYRPSDMRLIGGVKVLLHDQGMTIRGVQKLLREQGVKHVSSHSPVLDGEVGEDVIEVSADKVEAVAATPAAPARLTYAAEPSPVREPEPADAETGADDVQPDMFADHVSEPAGTFIDTSDLPARDPEDDDPTYPSTPGLAARLALASRSKLVEHRPRIAAAVARLEELRERLG